MPTKHHVETWNEIWEKPYDTRMGGIALRMTSAYQRFGINSQTGTSWAEFQAMDENGMVGQCRWFDYKEMSVNQRFRVKECTWRTGQRLAIGEGWGGLELLSSNPVEPDPADPVEFTLEERVEALEEWMERMRESFHD